MNHPGSGAAPSGLFNIQSVVDSETLKSALTFAAVDFSDGLAVGARTHLLLVLLSRADRSERSGLLREARQWLRTVSGNIAGTPADTLLHAISNLDLLHRITYGHAAPAELLGASCLRAFNERIHGNTRISDTDLYNAITERLDLGDRRFIDRPLRWRSLKLDRWYRETDSGLLSDRPLGETLPKIDILLSENLFAFTGAAQKQYRHNLILRYLPLTVPVPGDDAPTLLAKLTLLRHHAPLHPAAGCSSCAGHSESLPSSSTASQPGHSESVPTRAVPIDNQSLIIRNLSMAPDLPSDSRLAYLLQQ